MLSYLLAEVDASFYSALGNILSAQAYGKTAVFVFRFGRKVVRAQDGMLSCQLLPGYRLCKNTGPVKYI